MQMFTTKFKLNLIHVWLNSIWFFWIFNKVFAVEIDDIEIVKLLFEKKEIDISIGEFQGKNWLFKKWWN